MNAHQLTMEAFEAGVAGAIAEGLVPSLHEMARRLDVSVGTIRNRRAGVGPTATRPCGCPRCAPGNQAKNLTEEGRRRLGHGRGKKIGPMPEATKAKLSRGRTEEQRRRMRDAQRARYAGLDSLRRRLDALYSELFEAQGGMCAICGSKSSKSGRPNIQKLCMDHDHGKAEAHGHRPGQYCEIEVRALLCHSCNRYAGWLEHITDEGEPVARRAIEYLEAHP